MEASSDGRTWNVQQMLVDDEMHNDWVTEFEADAAASREADAPVMRLRRIGPFSRHDGAGEDAP